MDDHYTVVVVGSGYGGAIAASRLARAGQRVCLLERGREMVTGEYPDSQPEVVAATQLDTKHGLRGAEDGLYRFSVHEDLSVLSGNGLGGTSLINANVSLPPEPRVFEDPRWPAALRDDLDELLGLAMDRAVEMLRPTAYPDEWPALAKLEALERSAKHMGETFHRTPINVTFKDGVNHVGVEQLACSLCGDCVTGCNHGSKNTLLMNYLPDAKRHGAKIFCNVEVRHIEKEDEGAWTVHYRPIGLEREAFEAPDPFVRADIVILSAGALGSTEILLRSRAGGLAVSDRLGESFTGNGDVLGLGYNSDVEVHGIGYGAADPTGRPAVGPCITGMVDMRENPVLDEGLVIEEGVIPGAMAGMIPELLAVAGRAIGVDTDRGLTDLAAESGRELESLVRGPYHGAVDNTQTFLVMTHDDSAGRMDLDDDRLTISWPSVGDQPAILRANEALAEATAGIGGTYVRNPLWAKFTGRDLITVHPLGGCGMGDTAATGVVDHRGCVFSDTSGASVHTGLFVADGSIVPCAVGVNPLLTISALAERNVALLAAEQGWDIDYILDSSPFADGEPMKPGIRFTETMSGFVSTSVTADLAAIALDGDENLRDLADEIADSGEPVSFTFTIGSHDIAALLDDPAHQARVVGTVTAPMLHDEPLTVSHGRFELFSRHPDHSGARRMVYEARLTAEDGTGYEFVGVKIVRDDSGMDTWADTTTLYVTVHRASDQGLVGRGILRIGIPDFLRQLRTFEVTGVERTSERLRWLAKFGALFAGEVFEEYGPIAAKPGVFDPEAPPRKRRELRAPMEEPHTVRMADGINLRLTRYRGGDRGPVLVTAGIGVSSRVFSIDTIDTNMVEFLCASGFDVWLLDWRSSIDLPSASERWNLDVAAADLPLVVDHIRTVTGAFEIDAFVHCVGSIAFFLAVLRGMYGIRSFISSQVSIDTVTPTLGKWKAGLHLPGVLDALGVDSLTAYTDTTGGWKSKLFDAMLRVQPVDGDERCDSVTCHRGTFMYGLLWEHEQLNKPTHSTLHEWMGVANIEVIEHLALMAQRGHVVTADGDEGDLEQLGRLAFPITFLHGAENQVFVPEASERTLRRLQQANPGVAYTRHLLPGYGHLDPVMGANAASDVYPLILRHLEMVERHGSAANSRVDS